MRTRRILREILPVRGKRYLGEELWQRNLDDMLRLSLELRAVLLGPSATSPSVAKCSLRKASWSGVCGTGPVSSSSSRESASSLR